jgi:CRISPR-associated protein Cmr6
MKPGLDRSRSKSLSDIWNEFIQTELKTGSKLGKVIVKAGFSGYTDKTLTLYFEDEASLKTAKGQSEPLKKKLPREFNPCDRINFVIGKVPVQSTKTKLIKSKGSNPLQALNLTEFCQDHRGNELSQPILVASVKAEKSCDSIYEKLKERTETLVGKDGILIPVDFSWRLRVGGTRGFRELLLPVFHPVFGVPYIPSASLKGASRAWARKAGSSDVKRLLGVLDGNIALAAKVEFLDAFPTRHCLSVDVATPQWHWQGDKVAYKPEPHPLLSMEQPHLLVGLRPTSTGTYEDVQIVKEWLENSLKAGIGSRVNGGYGKALGQVNFLAYTQSFNFELWTQGLYGSEPPNKENGWSGKVEFRPTAIRGILRYWFRSVAMGLYDSTICQKIEEELFGQLSQQGKISVNVLFNDSGKKDPYRYTGTIILEATEHKYLDLVSQLLVLAAHLGGFGRGSRRPLHKLNGRMRGCHWSIDGNQLPMDYDSRQWQQFFVNLKNLFQSVQSPLCSHISAPNVAKSRYQDVLDENAQVWLVKSPIQLSPDKVRDWQTEGDTPQVRGSALTLLYGDNRFKGENRDRQGNRNVGGALEVPSFVWIKSIFTSHPYQVVTIFGVDQADRKILANELEEFRKKQQALLVYGSISSSNNPVSLLKKRQK